ncbi:SURF1 family protein [Haematomicrobium sanguinis]|uniref:SURF1 family protein n=1 Tax=Haematomicrobium sanguinis TaxID=479106 RepID=UPI0006919015|nr:SURF1 family protein [Haematomicrobium sanguinis]
MLRTLLKPKWIAVLLLALAVASAFVWLSQWQFSRSSESGAAPREQTETVRPLAEVYQPGDALKQGQADQMVSFEGQFTGDQVLIKDRILEDKTGYWVVDGVAVTGANATIPVVLGWIPDAASAPEPATGAVSVTGRLLPSEPISANHDLNTRTQLSTADLTNAWDTPMYAAFIANATFTPGVSDAVQPVVVAPQPEGGVNWLNIFYAVEWVVFAGFAIYLWWRLAADEYQREQEAKYDADPSLVGKLTTSAKTESERSAR